MATKLAAVPDGTIVLLIGFLQDRTGRNFTAQESVERLVERSKAPIYGFSSTRIGYGIVGGRLTDWERQGVKAGELGARLLRGTKLGPADIVTGDANIYMFDARQLRRFGLKESRLPPGSMILLPRVDRVWEQYRWPIVGGWLCSSLESGLVAGLVIQRVRRKRAEAEAAVQRGQLAHAQRVTAVGELTTTLAHEINQPLGAIVSNAEAARRLVDLTDPKRTDLLETLGDIIDDGQRASEVIRRLRAMLRTGATEQKPCDVNGLIVEVIKFLDADLARAGVSTDLRLREGLPLVRGDAIQLQQVILNLALNAEDAMANGAGEPKRLTVETTERRPGTVEVCVRDTGVGVKESRSRGHLHAVCHHQDVRARHRAVDQPVYRRGAPGHDPSRAQPGSWPEHSRRASVRCRPMTDGPIVYVVDDDASFRKAVVAPAPHGRARGGDPRIGPGIPGAPDGGSAFVPHP